MSREVERPPRPLVPVTLYGLVAAIVAERLVMAGDPPGRTLVIVALTCGGLTLTGCLLATAREGWDLRREQAVDEARGIVVTCLCCVALAVTSAGIGRARMDACADALAARPVSRVELVVCGDPSPGEWSFSYVANVRISGRVVGRVTLTCDEGLSRGQVLGCVGRFSRAGGDEWGRSCRQRGICGSVRCVSVIAVEGPAGPLSPILRARDALVEYVCPGRSEARAVLAGIVLGRRSELAERGIDEDFSRSGLAHLVAVSGTHIAIVSAALAELLERLRARPFPRFVALAAAGLAYVLLCGAPASALRAWLMSVSAGGALVAGRRDHALSSVALAGLGMCIADPGTAGELGFVLSVSCVCAISAFAGYASYALESLLSGIRLPHLPAQVRRRVEGMTDDVRGTVAMAVVAQAASAPLVAGTFGRLSVLGPVSCLVAGPAFLACMCLGLPAVVLAPAPVFGEVLLMVADVPCWLLVHVARTVGRVPLACVPVERPAWIAVVAVVGAVVLLVVWPALTRRLMGATALALLIPVAALNLYWSLLAPARVVVLDVGQGDAILVQDGRHALLVDAGPPDGSAAAALFRNHVLHLDGVLVTHLHDDHYGGLAGLVGTVAVDAVYVAEGAAEPAGRLLGDILRDLRVDGVEEVSYGDVLALGRFEARVVWPRQAVDGSENSHSIELLVSADARGGELTVLLTGDAERDETGSVVAEGDVGDIDVLKVGHHGSQVSIREGDAERLDAEVSVASAGEGNAYGHPDPACVAILEGSGSLFLCTKDVGDVEVRPGRDGPCVRCQRGWRLR